MSYRDNPTAKEIIDCVLKRNAEMFTRLGSDSTPQEYAKAREIENLRLEKIRHYDEEKIDRLLIK